MGCGGRCACWVAVALVPSPSEHDISETGFPQLQNEDNPHFPATPGLMPCCCSGQLVSPINHRLPWQFPPGQLLLSSFCCVLLQDWSCWPDKGRGRQEKQPVGAPIYPPILALCGHPGREQEINPQVHRILA